jgi:eukaryotic-like serine/threonine-protein kinase
MTRVRVDSFAVSFTTRTEALEAPGIHARKRLDDVAAAFRLGLSDVLTYRTEGGCVRCLAPAATLPLDARLNPRRWVEIRALFDELVELDAAGRARRLAEVAAADRDLHDAVELLLAGDAAADERLIELEFPRAPSAEPGSGQTLDPFGLSGCTISHFRVLDPIEAGGMGVVYRADDTRLNRGVALKFLLPQFHLDDSAKERFLQEARSAARLDHPNLCTVYEVGENDEGQLFFAMALYPGETLKARLAREGALPPEEAIAITRQIAQGLAYAHEEGIIHRDLKPGNVMLLPHGTVKILDFGLAKARDLSLTGPGAALGTVAYMAPEQIRDEAVDGRTDLWALGVVLYEMLTGRRPFGGEHEIAIVHAILNDEPARPSTLRAEVPAQLDEVVLSLLRRDIGSRYADAGALLGALPPSQTSGVSAVPQAVPRNWVAVAAWRRSRGRALAVPSFAILSLLAALFLLKGSDEEWFGRLAGSGSSAVPALASTAAEHAMAVLPFDNLSSDPENEYFSSGITDEILTTLSDLRGLRVISRTSVLQYRGSSKPMHQIGAELGVSYILTGSVQRAGDRVRIQAQLIDAARDQQMWAQRYDRPLEDIFAVQSEIAQEIARALRQELTLEERSRLRRPPTSDFTAYDLGLRGREYFYRYTPADNEVAIQFFRRALALDPAYVDALIGLADAYRIHGQVFGGGQAWEDSAVAVARRAVAQDPGTARAHDALGWALKWHDQHEEAFHAFSRAIELNPDLTGGLADLNFHGRGRLDEALRLFKNALRVNPADPILNDLTGWTYATLGMFDEAEAFYQRAIEIQPVYRQAHNRLAELYLLTSRPREAEIRVRQILENFGERQDALGGAGIIMAAAGDLRSARSYLERVTLEPAPRTNSPGPAHRYLTLAWAYQQTGERGRADEILRPMAAMPVWTTPNLPHEMIINLARLRVLQGDREGALLEMRNAVRKGWQDYYLLPNDPILHSLRGDPQFDQLLAEVKAEVDRQRARVLREGW